jgi:hypothetical protein
MAALKNQRHELFCRHIVEGKSQVQSYSDAGFKPNRHNAARLIKNEHIRARISFQACHPLCFCLAGANNTRHRGRANLSGRKV